MFCPNSGLSFSPVRGEMFISIWTEEYGYSSSRQRDSLSQAVMKASPLKFEDEDDGPPETLLRSPYINRKLR